MNELTAAELLAAQADGVSAEDITASFLRAIHQRDGILNAFLRVDDEFALSQARALDAGDARQSCAARLSRDDADSGAEPADYSGAARFDCAGQDRQLTRRL